ASLSTRGLRSPDRRRRCGRSCSRRAPSWPRPHSGWPRRSARPRFSPQLCSPGGRRSPGGSSRGRAHRGRRAPLDRASRLGCAVRVPSALTWVWRPWAFLTEWIAWLVTTHWLLPIALVPGLVLVWRRAGPALGVVALALVVHPLGMALLAPYRGPAFQEGRYSI